MMGLARSAYDEFLACKSLVADLTRHSRAEAECRLIPRLRRPAKLAIDVGANTGIYTTAMARSFDAVMAVEPNPRLASNLRRKFRFFRHVRVVECALSSTSGDGTLWIPPSDAGLASLRHETVRDAGDLQRLIVPLTTIDMMADQEAVGLIKIDVEGHEGEVLRGAHQTLTRCRPIVVVEAEDRHRHGAVTDTATQLAAFGYTGWFIDSGEFQPLVEFDPARHQHYCPGRPNPFSSPYINNFLFFSSEDLPDPRLVIGPLQ